MSLRFYFELGLTVMNSNKVHSMLLRKTGRYSVMLTLMELIYWQHSRMYFEKLHKVLRIT